MTSVIPQAWPSASIANPPSYPHQEQEQYTPQQALTTQQELYHPNDNSEHKHQYQLPSHHPHQHSFQPNELPRALLPINQEYDLNYPHQSTSHQSSYKRASRDPTLRSKTAKRVSKALPPDPLMKQRQRSLKNGSTNKNNTSAVSKDLPAPPASSSALFDYQEQSREASASTTLSREANNNNSRHQLPYIITDLAHKDSGLTGLVPYSPPPSKKGIPIERPYSYYKVAPKVPQSVTVIDSPFGPPVPPVSLPSTAESQRNFSNGNSTPTYYTHPSSSNPFVPPAQYQPPLPHQQQQSLQYTTHGDRSGKERPDPEDSIPVNSGAYLSATMAEPMTTRGSRERSNSDKQFQRATSPRPERSAGAVNRQPSDASQRNRSYSNENGSRPSRERQQPNYRGGQDQEMNYGETNDSSDPTRKGSGNNLLRIARKASDTALKGIGLSRKASGKKASQSSGASTLNTTYEQNSQSWSAVGNRSQPELHRGQHSEFSAQTDSGNQRTRDYDFARTYDTDLGRNRSLPDIKPPSNVDHRTPSRGSSLNNPKTNPGAFHSRQKSQHHLQGSYQITTAMSNEPMIATAISSTTSNVIQDAYGGTTDDWRQRHQAEKEARERNNLRDSSPTERSGHTSINSVSTLNLPPTTVVPTATSLNRSTSRILLPDRDRSANQSGSSQSSKQDIDPEPTQESTSLAKATVQPGGILAQLQAATEAGQVIDPAMGIWSQKDGRYIQRSNTAPYPHRENKTILEEDESGSPTSGGPKTLGPLEYSKSEGYAAASRNNRQQKRPQQQQQQTQQQGQTQQHAQIHDQQQNKSSQNQYPNHNDPHHQPHQQPSYQVHHLPHQAFHEQPYQHHQNQLQQLQHHQQQQQQRSQGNSRSRAMSNENIDTNKDLPPTPGRTPQDTANDMADQQASHGRSRHQRTESRSQTQRQPRSRSESQSESARRHQQQQSSGWQVGMNMTSESVLALSRSMSPPPNRSASQERTGANGQLTRKSSNGQNTLSKSNSNGGQKEKALYGIDMLPLPVIPSPDETLQKNANVGILPQDVLRTLDSQTVQKVVTQAVIASRVYKVLSLVEVENLKKEQEDLQKYVEALKVSLTIETRMRDASHSLIRLHENNTNIDAVKASTGQLHATTRKMDQIVQKIQQSMDRLLAIQRLLLQHEGAVLNAGMRRLDGENRELARAVQELETARDQEKEEKLRWKKEHSHLRIQSMIFPNPPGLEEYPGVMTNGTAKGTGASSARGLRPPSPPQQQQPPRVPTPPPQQQQHAARLTALENYMKELNEEISKKDERISQLESQLRLIKIWADDFAGSLRSRIGVDNNSVGDEPTSAKQAGAESSAKLQKQLAHLQSRIEDGFRALETNAHELKAKAQEAELAKEKALEFAATTLANTSVMAVPAGDLARSSSSSSVGESESPRSRFRQIDQQQGSRLRNPFSRSKSSLNESHHPQTNHSNNSDLNVVLNESLLELDLQLSSSSSANRSVVPTHDVVNGKGRQLSGENSASQRAMSPTQRQELTSRTPRSKQQPESKDDFVIGDANEEIRRLNAMVDELERLMKLKMK
ncbi:hypothetical protein BGX26_011873 [Mortierella sp. AD094]|nr:hypothetical protein BGX26_011873 [Mortierella sp. AD094]